MVVVAPTAVVGGFVEAVVGPGDGVVSASVSRLSKAEHEVKTTALPSISIEWVRNVHREGGQSSAASSAHEA